MIEILKAKSFNFVLSFHSVVLFATDTWYMCDRKHAFQHVLYLVLVVYEFFVSISSRAVKAIMAVYEYRDHSKQLIALKLF